MPVRLTKIRETPASAGCWLEGSRGWRATGALVSIAHNYGMTLTDDDLAILAAYESDSGDALTLSTGEVISADSVHEYVIGQGELADDAEQWLNDHVAPEGYSFGWHDGEFFLWSDETWEEDTY